MAKNTSISLGNHFESFINQRVEKGRFASTSDAIRAGLRLLELNEAKLDVLRATLAKGEAQLDQGQGVDGDAFMNEMIR